MDKEEYIKEIGIDTGKMLKDGLLNQLYSRKIEHALEIAWRTRDFEIKMYWKRATYYWAFITSIFITYFHILNSSNLFVHQDFVLFFIILIGSIFSLCWVLTNLSSKFWQSNWEYHINFLESEISGNIYGTVLYKKGQEFHPSISKINFCASCVILLIWIILLIHNLAWEYIKIMPIFKLMFNHILISKLLIIFACGGIFVGIFKYFYIKTKNVEIYRL